MGKKDRIESEKTRKRQKKGQTPFSFLGTQFDAVDRDTVKSHTGHLILASIITKLFIVFVTGSVFGSFVDIFDIGTYFERAVPMVSGQLPYIQAPFEYQVLLLFPILLAMVPAVFTQNPMAFIISFQILMVACDIVIVLCVYLIGLRIADERTAFLAGLVYATAFSTAYFVITKSDAFPTCLLMAALLFTVFGMNARGYICATAGFFTKLFPAVALPFMVLYQAKATSFRDELLLAGKIFLVICAVLVIPLAILKPETAGVYLAATGSGLGIYVNTATYTLYANLHNIFGLPVTTAAVSAFMYVLMGANFLLLLYAAFADRAKNPTTLLKLVALPLVSLVFFTKFHSPQYIVWFTPLLALLVADDLTKICLFYAVQVFAYIEFPLMFRGYYTNLEYTSAAGSSGWYLTLLFFTLEYLVLVALVYLAARPRGGVMPKLAELFPMVFRGDTR